MGGGGEGGAAVEGGVAARGKRGATGAGTAGGGRQCNNTLRYNSPGRITHITTLLCYCCVVALQLCKTTPGFAQRCNGTNKLYAVGRVETSHPQLCQVTGVHYAP